MHVSKRVVAIGGLNFRMRHFDWSEDLSESWKNLFVSEIQPDGI